MKTIWKQTAYQSQSKIIYQSFIKTLFYSQAENVISPYWLLRES